MPVNVMQVNHIRLKPIQLPDDPSRSGAGLKPVFTADVGLRGLHPNIAAVRAGYPQLMTVGPAAKNVVFHRPVREQLTDADTDLAGTANTTRRVDLNNPHFLSSIFPEWDIGVRVKGADTGTAAYERRIQVVHHEKTDDNTFGNSGYVLDVVLCMLEHFRYGDRDKGDKIIIHTHRQRMKRGKGLKQQRH